jgi:toxin YoeB
VRITFHENAWDDYVYWATTDRKILKRLNRLIDDIQRSPFEGIGKPEPLSHDFAGWWSRRIDEEHRIVYSVVDGDNVVILQARGHYGN